MNDDPFHTRPPVSAPRLLPSVGVGQDNNCARLVSNGLAVRSGARGAVKVYSPSCTGLISEKIEAYAVLTRLPAPHRLSPQTALALLENNLLRLGSVIALNTKSYQGLPRGAPKNNAAGGRVGRSIVQNRAWV